MSTTLSLFNGYATVTIEEDDFTSDMYSDLKVTVTINDPYGGDIRGIFFDFDPDSPLFTWLYSLSITGADITEIQREEDGVVNLGGGANMEGDAANGTDDLCDPNAVVAFDLGVEIGTSGASPDYFETTSIVISLADTNLTLDDLIESIVGLRVMSVTGVEGTNSLKLVGEFCEPPVTDLLISGTKYHDLNGNGVIEDGDIGLAGVTIFIDANDNGMFDADELSTVTADDGTWLIIIPGADLDDLTGKFVLEVGPDGYYQTLGMAGYAVDPQENAGLDFANTQYGSVSATKYLDADGNGMVDEGEEPITGWTFRLSYTQDGMDYVSYATDGGAGDADGAANGTVVFADMLKVGTSYVIAEQLLDGTWYRTNGSDLDEDGSIGTSGEDDSFDFLNAQYGSVSATKYLDANGNGEVDGDEGPLTGWTFRLSYTQDGMDYVSYATDGGAGDADGAANGTVVFADMLKVGTSYVIAEQLLDGTWYRTNGSDLDEDGSIGTSGEDDSFDFLNAQYGSVSATKYLDANGNGEVDGDEGPLTGWTFRLSYTQDGMDYVSYATDGGAGDADGATNGTVVFADMLKVGTAYIIEELALPDVWYRTNGSAGDDFDEEGSIGTSGEADSFDFLNTQFGSISGTKFIDSNGFGSGGELTAGVGWTINLYADANDNGAVDEGETLVAFTTTDDDGNYSFFGLTLGNYVVQEVQQDGYMNQTAMEVGADLTTSGQAIEDIDFTNFELENGTAQTPGFWRNWPAKFNQETHDEFAAAGFPTMTQTTTNGYELYFGVNARGATQSTSFAQALTATGGGESAFLRASAAGFANAATNEINYQIDEYQLYMFAGQDQAKLDGWLTILYNIADYSNDLDGGDYITVADIRALVSDIYSPGGDYTRTTADFTAVASALDAMNNMQHLDSSAIIA
ncbi:hypothetical protein DFH01_04380 [Falsiroseomonas bella]|uniref:SD-repeat containing protein B domain-containing protein n=1 Tax=Falsiroseomonas bella TaxID=2184016 RepID=A0A317FIT1_9PROT|nr:carboxypeptidase-like regulatory domain-containing protein [Falsiroseomonas bella]PWS38523.1 hypothetical protein DFH01_04380 [Falsiroseomonas bella]